MLSTLRSNKKRECPTGLELLGFRARGPKAVRVTDVKHFVDAPVPFVAISTDGEYEHGVMDREGLRKAEREGFRLRYMNNPATAWHWSHVYAATPQQLNQPDVRLSGQACVAGWSNGTTRTHSRHVSYWMYYLDSFFFVPPR